MGIHVTVRGLDGFRHEAEVAKGRLVDGMWDLMGELADDASKDARRRADPDKLTGRSMDSIRAHGPVITAGAGIPWYGFADFGGKVGPDRSISRTYIKGGRWLFPAVRDVGVIRRSEDMVDEVTKELRQ
jgi:hypothetical protein